MVLRQLIPLLLIIFTKLASAQSIISDLSNIEQFYPEERISEERVLKSSSNGKILILSHENKGFQPGDYVTLIVDEQLVSRAITAKAESGMAGIKVIKIYSLELWKRLKVGDNVKVLRGDDSYFLTLKALRNKKNNAEANAEKEIKDELAIRSEDDLFNDSTFLEEDRDLVDNDENKRKIKTDNILSAHVGSISGTDSNGDTTRYTLYSASWSYQFFDDIWSEISYGYSTAASYPSANVDTTITTLLLKVKWTITAPFYSFIQPYIGYQTISAEAPDYDAEQDTDVTLETYNQRLDELEKNTFVVGVSVIKRLVPGWFAKFDLGTDLINAGIALEF